MKLDSTADAPVVGVVHAPGGAAGLHELYAAAHRLCLLKLLFRAEVAAAHPDVVAAARQLFDVVELPTEGITDRVAQLGLSGLTTFHDEELDFVDGLVTALGLPGAPQVTDPWDKYVQRSVLRAHDLTAVQAATVDSAQDLVTATRSLGLPAVLKPRRAVGGGGLAFLDRPNDVEHQLASRKRWAGLVVETAIPPATHPTGSALLADFVSVETVSGAHERTHVAVFDKLPISVLRRGGDDGADSVKVTGDITPSRLPQDIRAEVLDTTSRALDALRVRGRVTHTELRVGPSGIEVIEVNGRVGGHLSRLLRLTGGVDLVRCALALACARTPEPLGPAPGALWAAGVFPVFPDRRGQVRSDVSRADLRSLPGVVGVDEIASHGTPRADTGYRVTNLTLRAAGPDELDESLRGTLTGLADLFAADGLPHDPWLGDVLR